MAKGQQARDRNKQKKLQRRRQREKQRTKGQKRYSLSLAQQPTPNLAQKVADACELIDLGKYDEAKQLLDRLLPRHRSSPAVVEAQIYLYQATDDHQGCSQAAGRLAKLTPRDPDARLMYAQESMYCGRVGIATANYRLFLERWPDHENAEKASLALLVLEPECQTIIQKLDFIAKDMSIANDISIAKDINDEGLELLVLHDEILESIQSNQFEEGAERCLEMLKVAPGCIPARNNLALSYFQLGSVDKAVHVAEETYQLAPENRFAEAALGKLRFLSGQETEANAMADQMLVDPPLEEDPLAAAVEFLSFLGRDEDIVKLSQAGLDKGLLDPLCEGMVLHHLAVAQCRLGEEKTARRSWKKCLEAMPKHPGARENLADLKSGEGHAPWAEPMAKWIPRALCDEIFDKQEEMCQEEMCQSAMGKTAGRLHLHRDHPAVAAILPAILDRGDPLGRELAIVMATSDGSPAMLDALQQFAFSDRGPDSMRHKVLNTLREKNRLDSGPHRFYSRGNWTEIQLFMAEIHWEIEESAPWVQELIGTGMEAMHCDYSLAEESFQQILDKKPDHCGAAYNMCVVWLQRDGKAGKRRALARIKEIHKQFPEYLFAPIALATFATMEGDLDRASELLAPVLDRKRLHGSEATALFMAQGQIAIKLSDLDAAEQSLTMLSQIAGEDHPHVATLRLLIDQAAGKHGLSRLLSWS